MVGGATERIYACWEQVCDDAVTKVRSAAVRALVVTNMWPSEAAPQRGVFVRDQVRALRRRRRRRGRGLRVRARPARAAAGDGHDPPAHARRALRRRPRALRARGAARARRAARTGGRDPPRQRPVRPPLAARHRARRSRSPPCRRPSRARSAATCRGRGPSGGSRCCPWASRSSGSGRSRARRPAPVSASTPPARTCCSRTIPARPLKRFDRAREAAGDVPLLTLGAVAPDEVPYWINAANAVLVPSEDEGFGLSVIEALACGVPAFGTPVGIHPVALHGIDGAYCAAWDAARWRAALAPVLAAPDPRVDGRARAALFSADRMADRVVAAWRAVIAERAGAGRGAGATGLYSALRAHRRPRSRPTMSGLLRRIKRSRPADAGEPLPEGQAAAPEGAPNPAEAPVFGPAPPPGVRPAPPPAACAAARGGAAGPARRSERARPGIDPAAAPLRPPAGRRGRLRRRLRYLRRARELMLRDLGGLLYEIHRTGGGDVAAHEAIVAAKVQRLSRARRRGARDRDRARRAARGERSCSSPGVGGTCRQCGELYGSEARFCSHCGAAITRRARGPRGRPPRRTRRRIPWCGRAAGSGGAAGRPPRPRRARTPRPPRPGRRRTRRRSWRPPPRRSPRRRRRRTSRRPRRPQPARPRPRRPRRTSPRRRRRRRSPPPRRPRSPPPRRRRTRPAPRAAGEEPRNPGDRMSNGRAEDAAPPGLSSGDPLVSRERS